MESKVNYTIVGFFVIVATMFMLGFVFWMAKYNKQDIKYNYFQFFTTESVAGLNIESPVKYKGFDVGNVDKIEINKDNPEQIKVILKIRENVPLNENHIASLELQGITGLKYVDILGGKRGKAIAGSKQDPATLKFKPSIIETLKESVEKIVKSVDDTTKNLNRFLSKKNAMSFERTMLSLTEIANKINKSSYLTHEINATLYQYSLLAKEYINLAKDLRPYMANIEKNINILLQNSNKTILKTDETIDLVNVALQRGDFNLDKIVSKNITNFNNTLNKSDDFLESSTIFIDELKESPSDLIFKSMQNKPNGPGESDEK